MSHTPEYKAWQAMIDRCINPKNSRFERYGGRGISVCDRWRHSFSDFYADVGQRPSSIHSLERECNDGNYEPGNVIWATKESQARNKASNVYLTFKGRRMIIADWARETGINYYTLLRRNRLGMTDEAVLTTPVHSRRMKNA